MFKKQNEKRYWYNSALIKDGCPILVLNMKGPTWDIIQNYNRHRFYEFEQIDKRQTDTSYTDGGKR